MELATGLHHSAQRPKERVVEEPREEELPVKHNATSGQNATPPWGVRRQDAALTALTTWMVRRCFLTTSALEARRRRG